MTHDQLVRANNLNKEMKELRGVVYMLERTINREKKGLTNYMHRFVRFCNGRMKERSPEQARVILFDGTSNYGDDVPVDMELLECLHGFFSKRLAAMQLEFEKIGGNTDG